MPILLHADARVSEELSIVLEALLSEAQRDEPVTLGVARERLRRTLGADEHSPVRRVGSDPSVLAELETLIEEFGADVAADDFVAVAASAELSEVIEALLDHPADDETLTLARVREAIQGGLAALMEARGALEADDEPALRAELEALIERYGPETPAEPLLRFD